ncbi:MAG: FHA domain-containing protein [Hyphomicrobiaceae bacterium]
MDRVFIRITDKAGEEVLAGEYDLPVTLGRGAAATVRFDEDRTVTSRKHAKVHSARGELVVTHLGAETTTAVNGVNLGGPGAEEAIHAGDTITISDYVIEIAATPGEIEHRPKEVFAFVIVSHGNHRSAPTPNSMAVGPSGISIVARDADGDFVVKHRREETMKSSRDDRPVVATLKFDGEDAGGSLQVNNGVDLALVKVNTQPVRTASVRIEHFDIVDIGNLRIEVTGVEPVVLRCINRECGRISPYRPDENCRYCGYRLVESQSVYLSHSRKPG